MKKVRIFIFLLLLIFSFTACKKTEKNTIATDADANFSALAQEKAEEYADNQNPVAIIVTDHNECIVFELYRNVAPQTVKNFISLANDGFYDGLLFHRVKPNFVIQGGDPLGNGSGGPGYEIFGEFTNNGFSNTLSHKRSVVSMARKGSLTDPASAYNTAGSQFFICVADVSASLDGDYAAFGMVLEGMDAVDRIVSVDRNPQNDKPLEDQVMEYVRVFENGEIVS